MEDLKMCYQDCERCLNPSCIVDEQNQPREYFFKGYSTKKQRKKGISSDFEFRKFEIENFEKEPTYYEF